MNSETSHKPATTSDNMQTNPDRKKLVLDAIESWIRKLIDKGRRNNLLYFRHLKTSTLDLSTAEADVIKDFVSGLEVPIVRFLPSEDKTKLAAKAKEIHRRYLTNLEERGLETLYVAVGMGTWDVLDGGSPPNSPILLIPASLQVKGKDFNNFSMRAVGDPEINPILLQVLEDDFGLTIAVESVLESEDSSSEISTDPISTLDKFQASAGKIAGFKVSNEVALANFSFQKMSMVRDLREYTNEIINHDLIAALAGDEDAREMVQTSRVSIDPESIDKKPPRDDFLILDADASQQSVIENVATGQDGVIQGPPGTGKSQTIANLISTLVARGKKVLFVAEKRAALEVVLERLRRVDLGHLALDLHGADISRKGLMQQLAANWQKIRLSSDIDLEDLQQRYSELRQRLNRHAAKMNIPRPPSGLSLYEIQGRLLRIPFEARNNVRWWEKQLEKFDRTTIREIYDSLTELGGKASLFFKNDPSPWNSAVLPDSNSVTNALQLVSEMSSKSMPSLFNSIHDLTERTGLLPPANFKELRSTITLLKDAAAFLDMYSEQLFTTDLQAILPQLNRHQNSFSGLVAYLTNKRYRQIVQTLNSFRRKKTYLSKALCSEASTAVSLQKRWRESSATGSLPIKVPDLEQMLSTSCYTALDKFKSLKTFFPRLQFGAMDLSNLGEMTGALRDDQTTPYIIPSVIKIEERLTALGLSNLMDYIRERQLPASVWKDVFDYAWLASCHDVIRLREPDVAAFDGLVHSQYVDEFHRLDEEKLRLNSTNVRYLHAKTVIDMMNAYPDEAALVRSEMQKKARHLPLRKLIAKAPHVLTTLCPCWMASPLSISQLVSAETKHFDVVLFDEASQVFPQDSIPAILRGHQVVVAGDRHQLPPTSFFMSQDEEEEDNEENYLTEGFESILDQMSGFLDPWSLQWHYRSRDEALIAFSNRHIYSDLLTTFPNSKIRPAVRHVLVESTRDSDVNADSPVEEVKEVVRLILEHAKEHPKESLGVIALGIKHQRRIQEALDQGILFRDDTNGFFDESRRERFFIKNLERVQGDERDAIILSIGYGKDSSGKLPYRFGPLLYEGGERRLNVAVTRARDRITLVSSFSHLDMDPAKTKSRGVELLRLYLEYAASGGRILAGRGMTGADLNPFEIDVLDTLTHKGIKLLPQYGVSKYRIDFAVQHPEQPGKFILAIECDGASYHSSHMACERDRLRQQRLEALGWRFYRIWSTDWFTKKSHEVDRFMQAYESAVKSSDIDLDSKSDPPPDSGRGVQGNEESSVAPDFHPRKLGRPAFRKGMPIDHYSFGKITEIIRWIESDGVMRTDDEMVDLLVKEMGFSRRGKKIAGILLSVIHASKNRRA